EWSCCITQASAVANLRHHLACQVERCLATRTRSKGAVGPPRRLVRVEPCSRERGNSKHRSTQTSCGGGGRIRLDVFCFKNIGPRSKLRWCRINRHAQRPVAAAAESPWRIKAGRLVVIPTAPRSRK